MNSAHKKYFKVKNESINFQSLANNDSIANIVLYKVSIWGSTAEMSTSPLLQCRHCTAFFCFACSIMHGFRRSIIILGD